MRRFGLIGYPLGHSFSKGYFAQKFATEGIADAMYENHELASIEQFPSLLASLPTLVGLNVTIPYKEAVIPYLDEIEDAAQQIGAVNTILIRAGKTTGYNTDYIGFKDSIQPLLGPAHRHALILGTGGSSKAVAFALRGLGLGCTFVSRQAGEGQLGYASLSEAVMANHLLIVNTSPIGMYPNVDAAPDLPYQYLTPGHLLYDLVYNPAETLFLKMGMAMGCKTQNGLPMLQLQAEAAWKIWNR